MLLPGENYNEQLMFTVEAYKNEWVDGRLSNLYKEAITSLGEAAELSAQDRAQIKQMKTGDSAFDKALEVFDTSRKGLRFAKVAAPLILADGPLPFGDVIFVIALGLDFGIAAYNLVADNE